MSGCRSFVSLSRTYSSPNAGTMLFFPSTSFGFHSPISISPHTAMYSRRSHIKTTLVDQVLMNPCVNWPMCVKSGYVPDKTEKSPMDVTLVGTEKEEVFTVLVRLIVLFILFVRWTIYRYGKDMGSNRLTPQDCLFATITLNRREQNISFNETAVSYHEPFNYRCELTPTLWRSLPERKQVRAITSF